MSSTRAASEADLLARCAALFDRDPAELAPRLRDGGLDLLDPRFAPTATQRGLDTPLSAWLYDALRDRLTAALGMPDFATELRDVEARLALSPGDVVLDVACGHGNFTVELARRVGSAGVVVGLDIASSMLARAAHRVRRAQQGNVLLVRGDALALPFRDAVFAKVNCAGGLHQMPDLDRALAELARVSRSGARFTASSFARGDAAESGVRGWLRRRFALHFVPVERLANAVAQAGFAEVETRMAGAWFAYASARR